MFKILVLSALIALVSCKARWQSPQLPTISPPDECLDDIENRLNQYDIVLKKLGYAQDDQDLLRQGLPSIPGLPDLSALPSFGNFGEIATNFISSITNASGGFNNIITIIQNMMPAGLIPAGIIPGTGTGTSKAPWGRSSESQQEIVLANVLKYMTEVYQSIDVANKKLIKILQDYQNSQKELK